LSKIFARSALGAAESSGSFASENLVGAAEMKKPLFLWLSGLVLQNLKSELRQWFSKRVKINFSCFELQELDCGEMKPNRK